MERELSKVREAVVCAVNAGAVFTSLLLMFGTAPGCAPFDDDLLCENTGLCANDSRDPATAESSDPGLCGEGVSEIDSDGDLTPDCEDECVRDAAKVSAGLCGCGVSDVDTDRDGTVDCRDACPLEADRTTGPCGCLGDEDKDGVTNCRDACPYNAQKVMPGDCGCAPEVDPAENGYEDCL